MIAKNLVRQEKAGLFDENRVAGLAEYQRREVQALRASSRDEQLIRGSSRVVSFGQKGCKRIEKSLITL